MNQDRHEQALIEDFTYSLAASPNSAQDSICFAARRSGLYRSDDGGATWRSSYDSLALEAPLMTTAVVVSPDFSRDQNVFAGVPGGILHSTDGGSSWYVAALPSPPPLVSTLVVSPNFVHDGLLLAGTREDGVFRSADRGGLWAPWNFGLLDLSVLSLAISPDYANDETIFVGTESGIFHSTNGGRAWREVNFLPEFAPVLSLALSPGYADKPVLFAGTESWGLYYSEDRGRTWKRLGEEVVTDAVNWIALSPEFPLKADVLVALGTELLVSRDGGRSWSDWKAGLTVEQGITAVAAPQGLDPNAPLLVGLVEGGVLRA